MYVSHCQDDWNTCLPLAEFSYNNSDQSSTKESPFLTVYGRYPHFDSVHITQDIPAGKVSKKIQSVQQDVKRELEVAIKRFKRYADKSRSSPPVCNPGYMVWLSSKNIKSTRTTKKLSESWLCPFPILKKFSTHAYHLKLPPQWKSIHPVFHISLLETVKTSKIPNRHQEPPPPIIIEEEEEWEVSQILDSKLKRGKLWYLVEWKAFSQYPERSNWESTENLENCLELLPQQTSPCVGAQELTISRWGVLSQLWQLLTSTPYGISVKYQSYGNLAISIITGQIGPVILSGLLWSFPSWGQPGPFIMIRTFQAILFFWAISGIFQ
ncbi:hypothetical protein O181_049534 [Austropuccinia psidii MF-1]|uniref:Chromo domain-containing protein n=1 Tax=Austropuccinia psidii MF-1 TaxID=1389203 RepID=A0A9Q3DV40_9BASI|nr:hypothetical protein [Austropuccinia psidii MF-1]